MSKGLIALAGFAGGMAKGALDYDQALKKTAAQERRDMAMHLRAMAMAKYKQEGAETLADINNQAAADRVIQQGEIQKAVKGMGIESSKSIAAADRKSRETIAENRLEAQESLADKNIRAASNLLEKEYKLKKQEEGSGYYLNGRELSQQELSDMTPSARGKAIKEGKLLTPEQYTQKITEAKKEFKIFENNLAIELAETKNEAKKIEKAKEAAKEAALNPKTDAVIGMYYTEYPELSVKKKQEVLEAYFLGQPYEHIIKKATSKSDEGGSKKDNESALNNPKVFSNLVAQDLQETTSKKGKTTAYSRPASQLNADQQVQTPSVDDDGTVMYDIPPRY